MTLSELGKLLADFGSKNNIDIACFEFDGSPTTETYIAYLPEGTDNSGADNKVWFSDAKFMIELYFPSFAEFTADQKLIDFLNDNSIYWEVEDPVYIDAEQMYLLTFHI